MRFNSLTQPVSSASLTPVEGKRRRWVWFVAGLFGLLLTISAILVLIAVARVAFEDVSPVDLARLVGVELRPELEGVTKPSGAEVIARIQSQLDEANSLAEGGGKVAKLAAEYAEVLAAWDDLLKHQPSPEPMIAGGLDTLRGGISEDRRQFWLGLITVFGEMAKQAEYQDKFKVLHDRMVASRVRLAELLVKNAPPPTREHTRCVCVCVCV